MNQKKEILDSLGGVHDFGEGLVPAHRHTNPDGPLGGWVANTVSFFDTKEVWVEPDAKVSGHVVLSGNVKIGDNACVEGRAHITNATIKGSANIKSDATVGARNESGALPLIQGNAVIAGNTQIMDGSIIEGNAYISGIGTEIKNAHVTDDARILGGTIHGADVSEQATITGQPVIIGDEISIKGKSTVSENVSLRGKITLTGEVILQGSLNLFDSGTIDATNPLYGHLVNNTYVPSNQSNDTIQL
jgi:carbonic anhydrase/acetyltransferase-like protein (isoleucine patch superfamily)